MNEWDKTKNELWHHSFFYTEVRNDDCLNDIWLSDEDFCLSRTTWFAALSLIYFFFLNPVFKSRISCAVIRGRDFYHTWRQTRGGRGGGQRGKRKEEVTGLTSQVLTCYHVNPLHLSEQTATAGDSNRALLSLPEPCLFLSLPVPARSPNGDKLGGWKEWKLIIPPKLRVYDLQSWCPTTLRSDNCSEATT